MNGCPLSFDPLSPEQLRDPYPVYERMRREAPVFRDEATDLWIVTRYADIMTIARNPEIFSSVGATRASSTPFPPEVQAVLAQGWAMEPTLTESDGTVHRRLRALVGSTFTPKRVADLEPSLRQITDELIDQFAAEGEADIIQSFAWHLPLYAITDVLGVPRSDVPDMHRWSDSWLRLLQATDSLDERVRCAEDVVALQRYFVDALESRVENPRDDFMSDLLHAGAQGSGEPLTMDEVMRVALNLIIAGHVTVTRTIGNGIVTLLQNPDQLDKVHRDPSLVPTMVEEVLRFESPAQALFRTAVQDTELSGVAIPAGAKIMVHWGSANRDESVFESPDVFDVTRNSVATTVAFGKGIHACLGAPLARLQLQIALPRLFERLPNLRLDEDSPGVRDTIFFGRGFKSLPVRWDAAALVSAP